MNNLDDSIWEDENLGKGGGNFGPEMPPGKHQALLVAIQFQPETQDRGEQLFMRFQNSRGQAPKWTDIEHEIGGRIAGGDLRILGFTGNSWAEAKAAVESGQFENLVCEINIKVKPGDTRDFRDVYLNACLGVAEDPSFFDIEVGAGATNDQFVPVVPDDDDIPF